MTTRFESDRARLAQIAGAKAYLDNKLRIVPPLLDQELHAFWLNGYDMQQQHKPVKSKNSESQNVRVVK